jgi:hypothetical protein
MSDRAPDPTLEAVETSPPHPLQSLWVPAAFAIALALISFTPRVASNANLQGAFWVATGVLVAWLAVLFVALHRKAAKVTLSLDVQARTQHYIQACAQGSVYLYWGYYWSPVYAHAWLLLGQLMFAYSFDMLLAWSRRERYTLGFGTFPIVFSTNLFMWFHDDWFALQFLMIAVGLLGKEFVRWERDGKSRHIFNPSAFTLSLFSLALIFTGTTDVTWGPQIATTLTLAPHIYVYLFCVGLVLMYFFRITPVTAIAASVLFGLSGLYGATTGVPYFVDSEIPSAVFLGLHLLVTDPSTSPRTAFGKLLFGAGYGVGVFALYWLLGAFGAPTFYDKLLCVPLLNLSVRAIDHWVNTIQTSPFWHRLHLDRPILASNPLHIAIWAVFFIAMTLAGRTDGRHTGDSLPFWQQACAESRRHACGELLLLETSFCGDNSAWACNELGRHYAQGTIVAADQARALDYFGKSCELRFEAGCASFLHPDAPASASPRVLDLRLLLRERGANLLDMPERDLYARACDHGWSFACERTASTTR